MAAISPAISYFEQNTAVCSPSKAHAMASRSADQICDELLYHMLDCDLCLSGSEHTCAVHQQYQAQLVLVGQPQNGVIFAI